LTVLLVLLAQLLHGANNMGAVVGSCCIKDMAAGPVKECASCRPCWD
jgi:hypothetical protein